MLKFTVFGVLTCSKKFVVEFLGDIKASPALKVLRFKIEVLLFGVDKLGFRVYFF